MELGFLIEFAFDMGWNQLSIFSDGVGRSGTYVLLDMVLNRMNKGSKEIDIAATLEHIRDQRSGKEAYYWYRNTVRIWRKLEERWREVKIEAKCYLASGFCFKLDCMIFCLKADLLIVWTPQKKFFLAP